MRLPPALLLAAFCSLVGSPGRAGEQLTVFYNLRPPYLQLEEGGVLGGLTGKPARQAFERSGIEVQWREMPTNRQLLNIRENTGPYCAVGWFDLPERRAFARFSRPLYRDHGWMVLVHAGLALDEHDSLHDVLSRPGLRVMVKDQYSYGAAIDALLLQYKPVMAVSTGTTLQMLQSLAARSVDLMFVSEEEGRYLMANTGASGTLRLLHLAQMPKGDSRHIMCSRQVPEEIMNRLDQAIRFNR